MSQRNSKNWFMALVIAGLMMGSAAAQEGARFWFDPASPIEGGYEIQAGMDLDVKLEFPRDTEQVVVLASIADEEGRFQMNQAVQVLYQRTRSAPAIRFSIPVPYGFAGTMVSLRAYIVRNGRVVVSDDQMLRIRRGLFMNVPVMPTGNGRAPKGGEAGDPVNPEEAKKILKKAQQSVSGDPITPEELAESQPQPRPQQGR